MCGWGPPKYLPMSGRDQSERWRTRYTATRRGRHVVFLLALMSLAGGLCYSPGFRRVPQCAKTSGWPSSFFCGSLPADGEISTSALAFQLFCSSLEGSLGCSHFGLLAGSSSFPVRGLAYATVVRVPSMQTTQNHYLTFLVLDEHPRSDSSSKANIIQDPAMTAPPTRVGR